MLHISLEYSKEKSGGIISLLIVVIFMNVEVLATPDFVEMAV